MLAAPRVERAWDVEKARARFPVGRGFARVSVVPEVERAVLRALDSSRGPLLVLGSHYLLGEAVPALASRRGVPPESLLAPCPEEDSRAAG